GRAKPAEVSQLDALAWRRRQVAHLATEKTPQVAVRESGARHMRRAERNRRGPHFTPEPLLPPPITIAPADPIDRAASRDGDDPAERLPGPGRIVARFAPDLEKRFLKHVVRFRFLAHYASDQRPKRSAIARIQFLKRELMTLRDFFHQRFIAESAAAPVIRGRKLNFWEQRHNAD